MPQVVENYILASVQRQGLPFWLHPCSFLRPLLSMLGLWATRTVSGQGDTLSILGVFTPFFQPNFLFQLVQAQYFLAFEGR